MFCGLWKVLKIGQGGVKKKNKKNAVRFLYDTISMLTSVRKSISIAKAHKVKLNKLGNAPTDCSQRLSLQCFGFCRRTHRNTHQEGNLYSHTVSHDDDDDDGDDDDDDVISL